MSKLFEPLNLRGHIARNRIMVSPMQQYAAPEWRATDYHLVHLGRYALGGAGIVIAEASAIEPAGRIASDDLGLWEEDQIAPLKRIADFLTAYGAIPGIQLIHAGRKGGVQSPWHGFQPLTEADAARGYAPWPLIGPSAISAGPGYPVPREMTQDDIATSIALWVAAADRAVRAGFKVINLHGAHGFLLHSFLTPLANQRNDNYGGSRENRMRYPLEVIEAIRGAIPDDISIFYRASLLDGIEGGWTMEDSIVFAKELLARGVDVIDCSSGGATSDKTVDTRVKRGYAHHAPLSREMRDATGGLVATVGLIVDPRQAEAILQAGDADIIAMGRELLVEPSWPNRARKELLGESYDEWHREAGWWLEKRAPMVQALAEAGETPMTRYAPSIDPPEPA